MKTYLKQRSSGAGLRALATVMLAPGAQAATAPATAPAADPAKADTPEGQGSPVVVVTGRRMTDASQSIGEDQVTNTVAITRKALLSAPAGISGLKMLEQLPGFNVQTDGALGLYEFGNSVQTRAYNLDQIGFVVDGIPTGRSDPFGGSPVFRYVDNENLGSVVASVGAGDVSLPSYSSLGPVVSYNSIAPQKKAGLFFSEALGDFNLRRNFTRLSTGQIGPVSAYVSRTKLDSDLWRGAGGVHREHWEAQAHLDLGGDNWARFKFVSNDFHDNDSPTLTRAQYTSTTPDLGGKTGRWRGYIDVPSPSTAGFTPSVAGVPYSNSNYTYTAPLAINVRNDRLYGTTLHLGIKPGVYLEATGYWEHKSGYGVSPDSYANSLSIYTLEKAAGLDVVAPKGTQYGKSGVGGDRYGITQTLHWDAGINHIEAGVWAELEHYHRTQARYNTADGSPASAPDLSKAVYLRRDYRAERNTTQIFLKDRVDLGRLELTAGIKGLNIDYTQRGYRDYADYYRVVNGVAVAGYGPQSNRAHYNDLFLPLVGAVYKLDQRTQLFASYAENMAEPKGIDDIFSVTLASSAGVVPAPAAERSQNAEFGIRTRQREFFASLATYYTRYKNRIQSITAFLPGSSGATETYYTNVGRVEAYGAEFSGNYKPAFLKGLAYFNLNATFNHARDLDNVMNGSAILYATAGKRLPDNATWILNGGVTVEPASWLVANLSAKYTSGRWSTLDNTPGSNVPAFAVLNAYVDIGDGWHVGPLKTIKARVNIDNLLDKDVLAFISTTATGDGAFRPLSPRTFQISLSAEY
jgi:iron complex outermembrane recepter protein